ncbi:MAG: hypothetical protein HQL72_11300 [Magnetococcales bacterium]|nr:hypothetical protein [Magnetococcales bacterium]
MFKILTLFLVSLALFGCASQEKQINKDKLLDIKKARSYCDEKGLKSGSEAHDQCLTSISNQLGTSRQMALEEETRIMKNIRNDRENLNSTHDKFMDMFRER